MLGRTSSMLMALAAAALIPCAVTPALAQCRLCTTPTVVPDTAAAPPVELQVETSLDFDRLILSGAGTGAAVLAPDGSRRTSGTVLTFGSRAMAGKVVVSGAPGRSVRVTLPRTITLFGTSGAQIRLEAVRSDLPALPRIGADGTLSFRLGGELHVSGNADGDFRGELQIDVDYL